MTPLRLALAALALGALVFLPIGCGDEGGETRNDFGPVSGERARETTREICQIGERTPGSEGIRQVAALIESELKEIDGSLVLNRQTFKDPKLAGTDWEDVEFQNLWCQIPGKDPENGPIIIVAAHYDSKVTHPGEQDFEFVGALDAAASCATLIEIGRQVHQESALNANVWLVWFDGEESLPWTWNDAQALIGSTWFAKNIAKEQNWPGKRLGSRLRSLVLLDLLGHEQLKIDKDVRSNGDLLDIALESARELEMEDVMFRFELSPTFNDDHIPFQPYQIRVLDLIDFTGRIPAEHNPDYPLYDQIKDFDAWWHTEQDMFPKVSARSLDFIGNLVHRMLGKIDAKFCQN